MFSKIFRQFGSRFNSGSNKEQPSMLGSMRASDGREISLKSVSVEGSLEGLLFSWKLRQEYVNETGEALEIIYSFPLPFRSVLLGMKARIGEKDLEGKVVPKKEAEESYEEAVSSGNSAIMVQQTGGGLYTANLGNIAPGEKVLITLQCAQMQAFEGDRIRVTLPLLTGVRYGDPHQSGVLASHESGDTSPEASYSFTAEISIKGEMAEGNIECPGWDISIGDDEDNVKKIALAKPARANKDFIMVLSDLPARSSAIYTPDAEQGMLCASFSPLIPEMEHSPLSLKILVDCSGSMGGGRIAEAQRGLGKVLALLKDDDQLSFSRFGSNVVHETKRLEYCRKDFINKLSRLVDHLKADLGGTEMEKALLSTFKLGVDTEDGNSVLLITDGDVWNIDNIVNTAKDSGHRIFIIGVGSAPGENLLKRMAEESGGACELVTAEENIATAIERMFKRMRSTRISGLSIDWDASPLWASRLPKSLFNGDTVTLYALFSEMPKKAPVLNWQSAGAEGSVQAPALVRSENYDFVRLGRKRQLDESGKKKTRLELALAYQLVTDLTSLILLLEREEGEKLEGLPKIQKVPQMLPEDSSLGIAAFCKSGLGASQSMKMRLLDMDMFTCDFCDVGVFHAFAPSADAGMDKAALLNDACSLWKEKLESGADFAAIYASFMSDKKFADVHDLLRNIKSALSLEQLFAAFISWAMEKSGTDMDRHCMRPIRYELRNADKAQLDELYAKLDEWFDE